MSNNREVFQEGFQTSLECIRDIRVHPSGIPIYKLEYPRFFVDDDCDDKDWMYVEHCMILSHSNINVTISSKVTSKGCVVNSNKVFIDFTSEINTKRYESHIIFLNERECDMDKFDIFSNIHLAINDGEATVIYNDQIFTFRVGDDDITNIDYLYDLLHEG